MEIIRESVSNVRWALFFKSFCFLFITTSIAAFLLYFGVIFLQGNSPYNVAVQVYDGYHGYNLREIGEHPFAFLLSISMFLSLSGGLWIGVIAPKRRRYQSLQALLIPWVAVILTSPVWGLIWSIYRWPPQGFSDPSVMMLFYQHDIGVGLRLGWLSAIISFPINILSYIVVYTLLLISKRLFMREDTGL